jgi:hypothetical protein
MTFRGPPERSRRCSSSFRRRLYRKLGRRRLALPVALPFERTFGDAALPGHVVRSFFASSRRAFRILAFDARTLALDLLLPPRRPRQLRHMTTTFSLPQMPHFRWFIGSPSA